MTLDVPLSAALSGWSRNPDGRSFITTVRQQLFDLWLLEGFALPRRWPFH